MSMEIISLLTGVLVTAFSAVATLVLKQKSDKSLIIRDEMEIKKEVDASRLRLHEGAKDVVTLMINNVSELREYYVISKRQANRAFSSTLIICILGFIVFVAGIVVNVLSMQDVIVYTTISGCIIEVISGLFFWLYKSTNTQLNLYHERLGATEKYLTAMQLAEKMSPEKKDEIYRYIIEVILIDNSTAARKAPITKEE